LSCSPNNRRNQSNNPSCNHSDNKPNQSINQNRPCFCLLIWISSCSYKHIG